MMADDENTTTEGDDFVILHKNSVFFPKGQNLDSPSVIVRGIVRDTRMSNTARIDISWSLVASLFFKGRTNRFSRNDCFCFWFRLKPILFRATQTDVFASSDDKKECIEDEDSVHGGVCMKVKVWLDVLIWRWYGGVSYGVTYTLSLHLSPIIDKQESEI